MQVILIVAIVRLLLQYMFKNMHLEFQTHGMRYFLTKTNNCSENLLQMQYSGIYEDFALKTLNRKMQLANKLQLNNISWFWEDKFNFAFCQRISILELTGRLVKLVVLFKTICLKMLQATIHLCLQKTTIKTKFIEILQNFL